MFVFQTLCVWSGVEAALWSPLDRLRTWPTATGNLHDKVDAAELLRRPVGSSLQVLRLPHVDAAQGEHLRASAAGGDVGSGKLGLLDVAADDGGVGPEMHQSADLSAANGAGTSGTEDDLVCYTE